MENRIKLTLMGLSYNPLQDGAFAMLLAAEGSTKRIPVLIGPTEAQSIAIVVERIKPERPVTHDLFTTMTHAFGIRLKEVFIYSFQDGIFAAEMTFTDGERQIAIDSRTSDAVAVAIRTGAPIYTTPAILEEAGVEFVEVDKDEYEGDESEEYAGEEAEDDEPTVSFEQMSVEELQDALDEAIKNDEFEVAVEIRRILDEREQ